MGHVVISVRAREDLIDIDDFLRARSQGAADRFGLNLETTCRTLGNFPRMGEQREEIRPSLRSFLVHPYRVVLPTVG